MPRAGGKGGPRDHDFKRRHTNRRAASWIIALAVCGWLLSHSVYADVTGFNLASGNFSQNWTNIGLITANDNWSGVPSIVGFRGDSLAGDDGDESADRGWDRGVVNVIANQKVRNRTGGVTEFQIADPTIALQGPGPRMRPTSSCT